MGTAFEAGVLDLNSSALMAISFSSFDRAVRRTHIYAHSKEATVRIPGSFMPSIDDSAAKRNTNLSLPNALVDEAKSLGINLSRAATRGLTEEIADKRAAQWLEENQDAISDWNDYVGKHGLPLARFRQF